MSESAHILSVSNLTKRFGGLTAVDDLSFAIQTGEIVGIIGPNGAGKTTVFNCVMGVLSIDAGTIRLDNNDIAGWDTHDVVNRGIARVPQHSNPIPEMTVFENIQLFTYPNSVLSFGRGADEEVVQDIAERVGIEEDLDKESTELTHAALRRLEVAKAVATDPKLILLDEPFAGLTKTEITEMADLIRSLNDEGRTIAVIDHNMRELMQLVDRVIVFHNGQKLAEGPPEEVAENPAVREAYLTSTEGTDE